MTILSPQEMYREMTRQGWVVPANIEPNAWMMPTAYLDIPTSTAFFTPPVVAVAREENAKLAPRSAGNPKGNRRSKRRVGSR